MAVLSQKQCYNETAFAQINCSTWQSATSLYVGWNAVYSCNECTFEPYDGFVVVHLEKVLYASLSRLVEPVVAISEQV